MKKKILLIDMDGVIVDLQKHITDYYTNRKYVHDTYIEHPDLIPDLFKDPPPLNGAIKAIKKLYESDKYEMVIATTAPRGNADASSQKRKWITHYFGMMFEKNMIITHRKDLLIGDYLIDDRTANGAGEFRGELLHFGYNFGTGINNKYPTWDSILKKLL